MSRVVWLAEDKKRPDLVYYFLMKGLASRHIRIRQQIWDKFTKFIDIWCKSRLINLLIDWSVDLLVSWIDTEFNLGQYIDWVIGSFSD